MTIKYEYSSLKKILDEQKKYKKEEITEIQNIDYKSHMFIERQLSELNKIIDLYIIYFKKDMCDRDGFFNKRMRFLFCGLSYELLMKIILLKTDWNQYAQEYTKNNNFNFSNIQKLILNKMNNLKEKNLDQYNFINDFLTILKNQRNSYAHSPFAALDDPIFPAYEMVPFVFLLKYFKIEFRNKTKLINHLKRKKLKNTDFRWVNDYKIYDYILK
jgi:hypothetical protein